MRVLIPSPLRSYTGGADEVESEGASVAAVLDSLDRRFPGIRFRMIDEQDRIRPHIMIFVDENGVRSIKDPVLSSSRVQIVAALSGG